MKESRRYRVGNENEGPLNARFEIDGKVFVTDRATLNLLNQKHHYSPRVAGWHFAINLATGRIKPANRAPAAKSN